MPRMQRKIGVRRVLFNGDMEYELVDATIVGPLAFYKSPVRGFNVCHIATGYSVINSLTRDEAREVAKDLAKLNWRFNSLSTANKRTLTLAKDYLQSRGLMPA